MAVDTIARALALNKQGGGSGSSSIETIQVNGVTQSVVDGVVNISVPAKTSELTNDSGFQTSQQVQETLQDYVPLATYNQLLARVEAIESSLNQPNAAILMVEDTGGTTT